MKKKLQIPYYISADAKDLLIRVSLTWVIDVVGYLLIIELNLSSYVRIQISELEVVMVVLKRSKTIAFSVRLIGRA
jgi:hypothetical protein